MEGNCVWMAGCQQTGTVDMLIKEGDRGRPQPQPQAQAGVAGHAETQRQVGTWFCMLMLLCGLCSKGEKRGKEGEGREKELKANK